MPILVRTLLGQSDRFRPRCIQHLVQYDRRLSGLPNPSRRRGVQSLTQRSQPNQNNSERPAQREHRALIRKNPTLRGRSEKHGPAKGEILKPSGPQLFRARHLSLGVAPIRIRQWRRIKGLRDSIAAGVKPLDINLSDGRRIHVYVSSYGGVYILANGPRRTADEIRRRLEEGDALALKIDIDQIRFSRSDQTTIQTYYSAPECSRALRVRWWIDKLSTRLSELRTQAGTTPTGTPLGDLARELFEVEPTNKMPVRTKWISLASWPQNRIRQENVTLIHHPSTSGELETGSTPHSVRDPSATDNQPTTIRQPKSATLPSRRIPSSLKIDSLWTSWTTRFERMSQGQGLNLYVLDQRSIGPLVKAYASTTKPLEVLNKAWYSAAKFQHVSPMEMWGDIMLWCLHNSPYRALHLLNASIAVEKLRPPRYVAIDCLTYLTQNFLSTRRKPDPMVMREFWSAIRTLLDTGIESQELPQAIDDNVIYWVLRHSNDDQARALLDLCMRSNALFHVNTLLHFLERSIEMGYLSLSIQILLGIAKSGFDLSSDQVQSACVKLVRTRINNESEYHVQKKLVTQLLEMGIVPEIALCNAIVLNAGEAGDFETAWHMYQVAKNNGLAPNSITYGVLFKSARLCGDVNTIRDPMARVINEVLNDPPAMQDLRLLHDVLAAMSLQRVQSHKIHTVYQQMLDLYKKYCSLAPLKDLHICNPSETQPPSGLNIKIQWPTHWIVGQMIASFAHAHRGKESLINVYNRYQSMFLEGHPLVTELAQSDFNANAFVKAFGQRPETLHHCTTVLKHMLEGPIGIKSVTDVDAKQNGSSKSTEDSSDAELDTSKKSKSVPKPSPPTIRTWSVLLWAYISNGQKLAAQKITQIMQDRGIRPDKITWSRLIKGYAGMQDIDATVDTIDRMQAAGYDVDAGTVGQLAKLWNRERLLEALKRVTHPAKQEPKKVKKPVVEVMTRELEAGRRKQKEAELYLTDLPSQLHRADDNSQAEPSMSVLEQKLHNQKLNPFDVTISKLKAKDEKAPDGKGDPDLDAIVQRLAGNAI